MAIIESVKKIFSKVLSIGKPSDEDVLYSKVIKKKIPEESAEELTLTKIKEKITQHFHHDDTPSEEVTESSTPPPVKKTPTKKTAKKKPAAKKPATSKKSAETKTTAKKPTVKKTPAKKPVTKKSAEKKTTTKKVATKKAPETKTKTVKNTTAPKGAKKAEKIALYIQDIKKHYGEVDEDFVAIIVKNLGPSIYKKDAELVSCSDPKELDTVRKSFLMKKLGLEASQGVMNAAIADVCQELKSTRKKYRATFYYALAKKFKKESVLS